MNVRYYIEWFHNQSKFWARIPTSYKSGDTAKEHAQDLADQCPNADFQIVRIDPEVVWISS